MLGWFGIVITHEMSAWQLIVIVGAVIFAGVIIAASIASKGN